MKVLVMSVHPDDETLGCGGTLLKHKMEGDEIFWLIATDMKVKDGFSKEKIAARDKEIETVSLKYNFRKTVRLGFPASKLDKMPVADLVDKISRVFNMIKPEIIYLPFRHDIHSDHRVFFEAAYSCTKSFRQSSIKRILMMEVISETEFAPALKARIFVPNHFVDITETIKNKIDIMKIYKSELKKHPFPRSIKNIRALATFRGAAIGAKYAEAFMVLKQVWPLEEK